MSVPLDLYPGEGDLAYEEEVLRNPFSLKLWWRYLIARSKSAFKKRAVIYERALKALPGSYKLWHAYLRERSELVRNFPVTNGQYDILNNTFERALVTMHKMPRMWIMYFQSLAEQKLLTRARRAFDRALCALPVTQHDRIWEPYLMFVSQKGVPIETSLRVYRRYLMYDPSHIEDLIEFLVNSKLWQEASERLAGVLNDDQFSSIKGKTKHRLWLELCDLLTRHAAEISGLNVDAIIRGGIRKFTDEVGILWTSLADYYIRRNLPEKARDVFEEGIQTVVTVRDFSVLFEAYSEFEEIMLMCKIEKANASEEEEEEEEEGEGKDNEDSNNNQRVDFDIRLDFDLPSSQFEKKLFHGFWLHDTNDVDLRLARFEHLMDRRPELANSVLLRQNPHNVEQWHRRVKLFSKNPAKQVLTYMEAVRTVDPKKAVGKPHTLWVSFAKLYETHKDVVNARAIFDKAVQVDYKSVDNLASIWCEWVEMELRHKNFKGALTLVKRATAEPTVEAKRKVAADGNAPVQMKLYKSLRLWSLYVDLEESLGSLDSARQVYDRILDIRIATPQIIINYALLLEENKYFEDAFRVYERGVKIFKYPHVKDIWTTYLTKFVKRYGSTKLERARELFENAVETTPSDKAKVLYLQYARFEEEHGLAKRAMNVYDRGAKAVPVGEKPGMYAVYIARAAEVFGVPKTREIYEQAIQSGGLSDREVKVMCVRFAELEKSLGEIDRARAIYVYTAQFCDPRPDGDFWATWHEFEVQHGNEDTFREMLRIKRSVTTSYAQTHFVMPEYLMQKPDGNGPEEAGVPKDDMAALERQLGDGEGRKVGFVSAGVEQAVVARDEEIELPEGSDSEREDDGDRVVVEQKNVPSAVFGGLLGKRDAGEIKEDNIDDAAPLGALERIKRQRQGH